MGDKMFGGRQNHILPFLLALATPSTLGMPKKLVKVGDMMLTAQQVPKSLWTEFGLKEVSAVAKSPGLKNEISRWPEGVFNYELNNTVSSEHKALIRSTLAKLETKLDSCIKFREVNSGFRVIVVDNNDCSSVAGYEGWNGGSKTQNLSLSANGCMNPSTIEHEFLHALGVFHTQQRTDRDRYIKINWDNIMDGFAFAFSKLSETEVDEFDLPYDFDSVMHYEQYAYSKNRVRTIETLNPSNQEIIGKAKGVSEGDIMLVKRMYKCNPQPPIVPTTATPSPTPGPGLLDIVEGDYVQSSPPPSNDWHYASISRSGAENSFIWKNKAGVEWELTFIGEESSGVLKFKVGDNCPYNNEEQGYAEARLFKKKTTIEIEGPAGIYTKQEK